MLKPGGYGTTTAVRPGVLRDQKKSSWTKGLTRNGFRRLIDLGYAKPIAVAKHGRPVVFVMAVAEFEQRKALDKPRSDASYLRQH